MFLCNQKDLVPLTIKVLNLVVIGYVCNAYKYLIQVQCPDIREYVDTDELDASSLQLLMSVTDQPIKAACDSITAIYNTALSLSNIFGISEQELSDDKTTMDRAVWFYEQIIIDDFPSHANLQEYSLPEYQKMLACFSSSTIEIIGCLYSLVAHGKVYPDNVWEPDSEVMSFLNHDYGDHQNCMVLDRLQRLGRHLCTQLHIGRPSIDPRC
jgi:hypothetical protein